MEVMQPRTAAEALAYLCEIQLETADSILEKKSSSKSERSRQESIVRTTNGFILSFVSLEDAKRMRCPRVKKALS